MNPSILNHLAGGHVQNTGALMMDFPGAGLIDAIIARNLHATRHLRTGDYSLREPALTAPGVPPAA